MRKRAFGAALVLATSVVHAQSPETLGWLRKMHQATQRLSYVGTFVYQNADRTETSRITRYAPEDIEKLEVMNGVPREIVRTRDKIRCYLPDSRVVKVDRRVDRDFPGLLPEQIPALAGHYDISLGESRPVRQMVFSDGLAAVSVFIEPLENRPDRAATGLASMGAIHIYTREVANHMITVVGEAPAVSVQRIADAVEFRRPTQ